MRKNVLFVPVFLLPRKTWRAREPRKNGEVDVPYRIGFFLLFFFFATLPPLFFCAPALHSRFIGGHIRPGGEGETDILISKGSEKGLRATSGALSVRNIELAPWIAQSP